MVSFACIVLVVNYLCLLSFFVMFSCKSTLLVAFFTPGVVILSSVLYLELSMLGLDIKSKISNILLTRDIQFVLGS